MPIGNLMPTLMDVARRLDPDGNIAMLAELLAVDNEMLQDIPWLESNQATGHQSSVRTGYSSDDWRRANQGIAPSKTTTKQVLDAIGIAEKNSSVDELVAELNGNTMAWRFSEDIAQIDAMNQQVATAMIYGDTSISPEQFMGLAPRFSTPSTNKLISGYNMVDGGGTSGDNGSIWLVNWGPNQIHGIYPKGSKAGLEVRDMGREKLFDSDTNPYYGFTTNYRWKAGLVLRDWRYVVRYCNIDMNNLNKGFTSNSADLIDGLVQMKAIIKGGGTGRAAFYCNKVIKSFLERQALNQNNVRFTLREIAGLGEVLSFGGIPVRTVEALTEAEARITGTFKWSTSGA